MSTINTRNDMLSQVNNAINYMTKRVQTNTTDKREDEQELQRLQRLQHELQWFTTTY